MIGAEVSITFGKVNGEASPVSTDGQLWLVCEAGLSGKLIVAVSMAAVKISRSQQGLQR